MSLESEGYLACTWRLPPIWNALAEGTCREWDRDTPFTWPPCSQKYLVKPYWGMKECFPLLTLDKGDVSGNLHTRLVAVVLSRHRCAPLRWLKDRTHPAAGAMERLCTFVDEENEYQGRTVYESIYVTASSGHIKL